MPLNFKIYIAVILSFFVISCSENVNTNPDISPLVNTYPEFPPLLIPAGNRLTQNKVELGRMLFYEKALSRDSTIACSSCHKQSEAFASKGNAVNPSVGGQANFRNVPPVFNIGYYNDYFWDGRSNNLEQMFHDDLTALTIFNNDTAEVIRRLDSSDIYRTAFKAAFGDVKVTAERISSAIACFVRTIVSGDSKYDRFIRGDSSALNENEKRGMDLFFTTKTNCSACHTPPLFTDMKYHSTGISTHYFDFGRYYVTGLNSDRGKFRTPTVRNAELTAPYMHNGEITTLEELIEHYNRGGKLFINKSVLIKSLNLTTEEKNDIISFLKALTDVNLITSKKYGSKK